MLKKVNIPSEVHSWYKDAIIYELHVRAFYDSDGDGIGDFRGLTERLDYLRDLGITALWLLPFYPSPLKDDGYDISSYTSIHPSYGTMQDFTAFLREAHRRGLRVITELVLNHTSDQHNWFRRARLSPPGSRWRDFYVWSDTPEKFREARIIFKDFEISNWTWDHAAKAYYWHRFYSHQPDLNYDNPAVRRAMFQVVDFWLELGVDGLRLDAVPYLFEREGTNCENLPETHQFLKELRSHVDSRFSDRMLLGEANQWPEDARAYFGDGDECHMAFHFPLMPRLFMAIRMEDRFPIVEIMQQTPPIPETSQWALFLRNHDELTLEMVTDEERDYMYRVYAHDSQARVNLGIRRRLAPLLNHNRRKIELMKALLISLPGTPVLYYGDEIGMGDNIYLGDRNGVRTPFQWSPDRNAGFSRATPQKLYLPVIIDPEYHYEAYNVEAQQNNPSSILWFMKRLISLRKRYPAISRGSFQLIFPSNHRVLAFIRSHGDQNLLCIANLSRFAQPVELALGEYNGMTPVEAFGQTRFPRITAAPYLLTLGPHSFLFFSLEAERRISAITNQEISAIPTLTIRSNWEEALTRDDRQQLTDLFLNYVRRRRWFGGKARNVQRTVLRNLIPLPFRSGHAYISLLQLEYTEGEPETYVLALAFASGMKAEHLIRSFPEAPIVRLLTQDKRQTAEGILFDALYDNDFAGSLLHSILRKRHFKADRDELAAIGTPALQKMLSPDDPLPDSRILQSEQSNSNVVFGDKLILKFFRRLEPGINPELEIGQYLGHRNFPHAPLLTGAFEYRSPHQEPSTLAILQRFVPNEGDAWHYTLDFLNRYFERALTTPLDDAERMILSKSPLRLLGETLPASALEIIGSYMQSARLLGERTAQLHIVLSEAPESNMKMEPLTELHCRAMYHSISGQADQKFELLRDRFRSLSEETRTLAEKVLNGREEIAKRARSLLDLKIDAMRIRCHGDYHLGQLLYTGRDFVIIDFEGEPQRLLGQRRIKYSPLRDVAGMLRSFHYASHFPLQSASPAVRPEDEEQLNQWAHLWYLCSGTAFLKAYLDISSAGAFLPKSTGGLRILLEMHMLEKAIYELGYEMNNRPEWIKIPLEGILQIINDFRSVNA